MVKMVPVNSLQIKSSTNWLRGERVSEWMSEWVIPLTTFTVCQAVMVVLLQYVFQQLPYLMRVLLIIACNWYVVIVMMFTCRYLTSLVLIQPLILIGVPIETACSVTALRAHNIIFVIINFIMINCVMSRLQKNKNTTTAVSSFVLSLFPVCYFFTFLYYTDQGSLCCVLLSYWLSLCGCHVTSGMVSNTLRVWTAINTFRGLTVIINTLRGGLLYKHPERIKTLKG